MNQVVANVVTLSAVLILVLAIFIRYLVPSYPAEGVDPLQITFNLALAQYGGVIQDYQLVIRKKEQFDLDTSKTLRSLMLMIQRLLG